MSSILIVDDSVSVRKALERILAPHDMQVVAAESAEDALVKLTDTKPDLMIADIVMPGMDGFELSQVVRADEQFGDMPIILISGIVNASVQEQAEEVGAVDVIKKPFNPADLIPKLKGILNSAPVEAISHEPADSSSEHRAGGFEDVERELQPFLAKDDIESILLVDPSGDCLLALGRIVDEPATLAQYFKFFSSAADILGDKLDTANLQSILLEYEDKVLVLNKVYENHAIVLVLRDVTVLSMARFLLKKQLPTIEAALKGEVLV